MSGYSSREQNTEKEEPVRQEASLDISTNNDQASSWGNGLVAESITQAPDYGNNFSPSMSESFAGISQDLSSGPGFGPNGGRNFSDWSAAGAGGAYGGEISGMGPYSWQGGFGMGAGLGGGSFEQASSFSQASGDWNRVSSGYGGGAAVAGRVDSQSSMMTDSGYYQSSSIGGDVYRGVGGGVYEFNDTSTDGQTRSGVGMDASYTPLGFNDANASFENNFMSANASAGNISVGQTGGYGEAYQTGDGGYGVQGGFSQGRTSATDLQGSVSTPLGTTDASVGSISQGRFYNGGVEVGPDGSVTGNFQRGGALTIQDANVTHDGVLGTTEASMGRYGGIAKTQGQGGYDATENQIWAEGSHGQGQAVDNVSLSHTAGPAHASVGAGRIEQGWKADGSANIDLDDGSIHAEGNYSGNGVTAENVTASYGIDGLMQTDARAGNISNATTVTGANFDASLDDGINASVEQVRTGGVRAQDLEVNQSFAGVNTTTRVGEISNDVRVDNAYATVDGNGVTAGAGEVDFGGIRVQDASVQSDLGGYGDLNATGSFGNGNNFKDIEANIGPDGASAHVGSFGVMGTDATGQVDINGPGGTNLSAGGTYHSGLGGTNVDASIGPDGASLSAENLNYNQHQIKDAHISGGIDGVYESSIELGEAHLNQANINDLQANFDGQTASLSVGESNYSYAGVSDLHTRQELAGGAVGTELNVGEASYLGGGVESAEFQRDFLNGTSSANIDGLNVHGLTAEDVNVGANVGDLGASVGVDNLEVLNANVENINHQSSNHGLTQSGSITGADVGLVSADNLGGSLSWGGEEVASAHADIDARAGVDHAEGQFDLTQGTASGSVENANLSTSTNLRGSFMGHEFETGEMGAEANFSGAGEVDVMSGRASGEASLAGSSVTLFGNEFEAGEWAQASGAVDLSKGEASANIGGENGVGFDASLSEGNLDVNIAGYEIDVDQGIRDAGTAIADGASYVGGAIADGASAVGGAISDGASAAWDAVTSW